MTRDEFMALAVGARVVVKSGKLYQVTRAACHTGTWEENKAKALAEGRSCWSGTDPVTRPDGWVDPSFQQWRTGEAKYPAGRLYGPSTKLKHENLTRATD